MGLQTQFWDCWLLRVGSHHATRQPPHYLPGIFWTKESLELSCSNRPKCFFAHSCPQMCQRLSAIPAADSHLRAPHSALLPCPWFPWSGHAGFPAFTASWLNALALNWSLALTSNAAASVRSNSEKAQQSNLCYSQVKTWIATSCSWYAQHGLKPRSDGTRSPHSSPAFAFCNLQLWLS